MLVWLNDHLFNATIFSWPLYVFTTFLLFLFMTGEVKMAESGCIRAVYIVGLVRKKYLNYIYVYVVVKFLSQVIFIFLLFQLH